MTALSAAIWAVDVLRQANAAFSLCQKPRQSPAAGFPRLATQILAVELK